MLTFPPAIDDSACMNCFQSVVAEHTDRMTRMLQLHVCVTMSCRGLRECLNGYANWKHGEGIIV